MNVEQRAGRSSAATLPESERRLHRKLMESMIATGNVPPAPELASELGLSLNMVQAQLKTLADADYLGFDPAGRLICLYSFSVVPTPHVVFIDGERGYAMCSLDALGMAAMLGRTIEIDTACPVCQTPIRLEVRPGKVESVDPIETVVIARRDANAPAFEACCGFTVFACGSDHAAGLLARTSETLMLGLPEALVAGEAIFAGMLGNILPNKRIRATLPLTWS